MKLSVFFILAIVIMITNSCFAHYQIKTEQHAHVDLAALALESVAIKYKLPVRGLKVINSTQAEYLLLGVQATAFKILDSRESNVFGILLDERGEELNTTELQAEEAALYKERYGKLDSELMDYLETVPFDEPVPVCIWVNQPDFRGPVRPDYNADLTSEQVDALYDETVEYGRAFTAEVVAPVVAKLKKIDQDAEIDELIPIVYANLSRELVLEISQWDEVEQIYIAQTYEPCMKITAEAIGAALLHKKGITGSGYLGKNDVRVAVIESTAGTIHMLNPYLDLSKMTWDNDMCMTPHDHTTEVVGVLVSQHVLRPGISPGVKLYLGSPCKPIEPKIQAATNRAIQWKAQVINYSFGRHGSKKLNSMDKYVDEITNKYWRTFVIGAGNLEEIDDPAFVSSPAKGYNIISVGAVNHNSTAFPYSDDFMWRFSCFWDPQSRHQDREKPEVVAPGALLNAISQGPPWDSMFLISGTSFAAPIVAGSAALLINQKSILATWPEAIKAVLLASACHDVQKNSMARDGAGMIDVHCANAVIHQSDPYSLGGGKGDYGAGNFSTEINRIQKRKNYSRMQLEAGKKTRMVFVWSQNTSYSDYQNQPSADFDMFIYDSQDRLVAQSTSYDCNYELVEFVPQHSGEYRISIQKFRCDKSPGYYAWAWWQQD